MTVHDAMGALGKMGFSFRLEDSGEVKFRVNGERPPEASALLAIARADRAAAADYVRQRQSGATVTEDGCTYSVLEALAIAQAVRKGEAALIGKIVFHTDTLTVTVRWHPIAAEAQALLDTHKKRLEQALQRRLQEMEQQPVEGLTEAEMTLLCEKYDRYKSILHPPIIPF